MIPTKLQKQIVNGKCITHKYRRFARNNKTYKLDVYFCSNCGKQVKIGEIFGHKNICWKCGDEFSIPVGMLKLFPICQNCDKPERFKYKGMETDTLEWMEDQKEKETTIDDLLKEVGLK
jgi:hypothetical protein